MQSVRVTLTANGREAEIHPMFDVVANASFVEYATAMQWNLSPSGFGILHYVEGDVEAFEDAVADVAVVVDYALEPVTDDAFYAYVRDEATPGLRAMLDPLENGGVVVVPPVVYHGDGTVTLSAFGPSSELQGLVERTPAPLSVEVEAVGSLGSIHSLVDARLSTRQRRAVEIALELGYYEVPREATHEDVAAALDCAPSTAAEHLRKAESTLLRSALART
ncbi:helix-turn-helix domain-containing protein [Halorubellus sp. JP-L1]|uniref:helix-turn-helix domain-containing protein n=1 Tax=Halorubellus sp. JP-L1 TaxID=2715753 RepID=UPI0014088FE5|nr:helix-turn-helix domain-containing protein [Halorubellus sp. JP-L1]NHN40473.1 helix-turn-helix domain-containing protein [Halorubellus sp. JP-L1]